MRLTITEQEALGATWRRSRESDEFVSVQYAEINGALLKRESCIERPIRGRWTYYLVGESGRLLSVEVVP